MRRAPAHGAHGREGLASASARAETAWLRSDVDGIDRRLVLRDNLAALELLDGGEHVVLGRPQLLDQDHLGRDLELGELGGGARRLHLLEHAGVHLGVGAHLGDVVGVDTLVGGELLEVGHVGADERDRVRHRRCRVQHRQRDEGRRLEGVLDLGERNVLAHLQLDQVLLAVDDHQVARRRVLADVARAEVADPVDRDEVLLVLLHDVHVGRLLVHEVAVAD
mmetsp:Transcript_44898/g.124531  ORF Transcript_44898/g.124531 Transcript_44898/m.124531 type:complete len:222 (+) Transcript_44898:69-734(+)